MLKACWEVLDLLSHQVNPLSSFRLGEEPYLTFGHWWLASHRPQLRPMNIWGLLSKEAMKVDIKPGMLLSIHKLYSWLGGTGGRGGGRGSPLSRCWKRCCQVGEASASEF